LQCFAQQSRKNIKGSSLALELLADLGAQLEGFLPGMPHLLAVIMYANLGAQGFLPDSKSTVLA
jgi:hypothetical protein